MNSRLLQETDSGGITDYVYDENGNLNSKNSPETSEDYTYNKFNQMIEYSDGDMTVSYAYRPDGLRDSKIVSGSIITLKLALST